MPLSANCEVVGDSSLPVGDYFWNRNGTGWLVAVLGAQWYCGLNAGAFCWILGSASSTRALTIVTGKQKADT